MRVLITGGGTAGHIMPAVEVAKALKAKVPDAEFLWVGSTTGMEKDLVPKYGFEFTSVSTGKVRRYFSFKNISDMAKIPGGILQAGNVISRFKPQVVFSKGGFVSIPAVIAAWMQNIPVLAHESDIVPGLANTRLAWYATKIALSFPDRNHYFDEKKTFVSGIPVRQDIYHGKRERALEICKFKEDRPIIVVTGGSQGSVRVNEAVLEILPQLLTKFNVIHIAGDLNYGELEERTKNFVEEGSYRLFGFVGDEMPHFLAAAEMVIARAGATSTFELIALKKKMLLIPLAESANNHQHENAQYFAEAGVAKVLLEKNLEPHILYKNVMELLYDVKEEDIAAACEELVHEDAAAVMADWLIKLSYYGKNRLES